MKPAIVFVASFVVAAAGSTGAKVMLTKPHAAAADSTKIGVAVQYIEAKIDGEDACVLPKAAHWRTACRRGRGQCRRSVGTATRESVHGDGAEAGGKGASAHGRW